MQWNAWFRLCYELYYHNSLHINHAREVVVRVQIAFIIQSNKKIGGEEIIHNIFSTYVKPLLNYINHPESVQEWKLNIDAPAYEKKWC